MSRVDKEECEKLRKHKKWLREEYPKQYRSFVWEYIESGSKDDFRTYEIKRSVLVPNPLIDTVKDGKRGMI